MKFNNPYLSNVEKANLLQLWIIVHSMLYYEFDNPIISDEMFDRNCVQLVDIMNCMSYNEIIKTRYYNIFYDFEGSTGFYLCGRLNFNQREYIIRIINMLNEMRY